MYKDINFLTMLVGIVFCIITFMALKKVYEKTKYFLMKKTNMNKLLIVYFFVLAYFQHKYHLINLKLEYTSTMIGIFAIYGIYFSVLNFSIGHANNITNDKVFGISMTSDKISSSLGHKFLQSRFFIALICNLVFLPLFSSKVMFDDAKLNFVNSLWSSSVLVLLANFVLLFIGSLNIMGYHHSTLDQVDYTTRFRRRVVNKHTSNLSNYLIRDMDFRNYDMLGELNNIILKSRDDEYSLIIKRILIRAIDELIVEQLKRTLPSSGFKKAKYKKLSEYKTGFINKYFEELLNLLDEHSIEISFDDWLCFLEQRNKIIYNNLFLSCSGDNDIMRKIFFQKYVDNKSISHNVNSNLFSINNKIFKEIKSIDDCNSLIDFLYKKSMNFIKRDLEENQTSNGLYGDYEAIVFKVLEKAQHIYIRDNIQTRRLEKLLRLETKSYATTLNQYNQEILYRYIRIKFNENSEDSFFVELFKMLEFKYFMSIASYFILYPGSEMKEVGMKIFFMREIFELYKYEDRILTENDVNFASKHVSKTDIGYRIEFKLVKWIFLHFNDDIDHEVVQKCFDVDYLSLPILLKYRYIFNDEVYKSRFYKGFDANKIKYSGFSWEVVLLREFLAEKELVSTDMFLGYRFYLSDSIFRVDYPDDFINYNDLLIFYIMDYRLRINESLLDRCYNEYVFDKKGLSDYIILNLDKRNYLDLLTPHKNVSNFKKYILTLINASDCTTEEYIDSLVKKVEDSKLGKVSKLECATIKKRVKELIA